MRNRLPKVYLLALIFGITPASLMANKARPVAPRYLRMENLTVKQLQRLDRSRTVVVMTIGILEEHGPDLPVSVDTVHAEAIAQQVIRVLNRQHPDWTVVRFPLIPLGVRVTNVLGAKPTYMGSFTVRPAVLRDVLADLGTMLAEQGFRDILVVYAHGNPTHSQIVNEACAFVRETTGIHMWNLTGLALANWDRPMETAARQCLTPEQRKALGMDIHAGLMETSVILYLAPQLVDPDFRNLSPVPAMSFRDILQQGSKPDWPGYWTYPSWASARCGKIFVTNWANLVASYASRAINGEDLSKLPQYPGEGMSKMDATTADELKSAEDAVQHYEDMREDKLHAWLRGHGGKH